MSLAIWWVIGNRISVSAEPPNELRQPTISVYFAFRNRLSRERLLDWLVLHPTIAQGTTGSISAEGWVLSWKMVFVAVTHVAECAPSSPVLRLRSKRGKLLLETSSRSRWPVRKTLLVAQRSMESK